MNNKELKKRLIKEGYCEEYSQQRFKMRQNKEFLKAEDFKNYKHNEETISEEEFKALQQLFKARKEQRKKIRRWITYYLQRIVKGENLKMFFATFTYKDTDKEISAENLKKKIIRRLSPNCIDYIINVDYGRENERLHYHAIVILKDINNDMLISVKRKQKNGKYKTGKKLVNDWLLNYEKNVGFYDMEPVENNDKSMNKLSNYVNKLVLHSIKVKQSLISTKKGTKYQKLKECEKIISKPINERTERENDLIKEYINIEKLDNIKHFKDLLNYLEMPKSFRTGTTEELLFYYEEAKKKKQREIEKQEVFDL